MKMFHDENVFIIVESRLRGTVLVETYYCLINNDSLIILRQHSSPIFSN